MNSQTNYTIRTVALLVFLYYVLNGLGHFILACTPK